MFGFQFLRSSFSNTARNTLLNKIKTNHVAHSTPILVKWQYKYKFSKCR